MTFLYNNLTNKTPIVNFHNDHSEALDTLDKHLTNVTNEYNAKEAVKNYTKYKKLIIDEIINYNSLRFLNGQLYLAIISLIYFNLDFIAE
tara:strand:+ start:830 stop:1099 length:270 start_codon:yes stop_codon:yes gene_type:complete